MVSSRSGLTRLPDWAIEQKVEQKSNFQNLIIFLKVNYYCLESDHWNYHCFVVSWNKFDGKLLLFVVVLISFLHDFLFSVGYQDGHLPPNPFSPHLAFTAASQKSVFSEHPATPGSGSITLPGSLEGLGLAE